MVCEYQPACPGCPRYGDRALAPVAVGQLEELCRIWLTDRGPECIPCEGLGSRYRARLSVRGKAGALGIGIFEKGSHRLVPIPRCGVHHPSIAALLPALTSVLCATAVSGYDEARHVGELRAVQLAVEPSTGRVQVVLLINLELSEARPSPELERACEALRQEPLIQGLFLGSLPERGNSLFAKSHELVFGAAALVDECAGAKVFFPPGAFGQANPVLHRRVAERVGMFARDASRVVEYYAGVGTLGLGLAAAGKEIVFNEIGEGSIEGLKMGWDALGRPDALRLVRGSAGQHANLYRTSDTVLVDPPRKGLDRELLSRLVSEPPERLIYLSCGIDALVQESRALAQSGQWALDHLSGWAYFPHTEHVETLLVATRRG